MKDVERKTVLKICNTFINNPYIPEPLCDKWVVDVIEYVYKQSIYDIPEDVIIDIQESLDFMINPDNLDT